MAKNTLKRPLLRKVVRGYSPEQVDLFVSRAIERVASLNRENESLRRRLDAALSEIGELKRNKDSVVLPPEDGEAAREALTGAAETLLALAEKFGAKEENVPEETEVGVFAEEPEKTEEPEEPVESDVYEEPAGAPEEPVESDVYGEPAVTPEEPVEEVPAGPADDVGDGAEEIFYEEEIENEEEVAPAAEAPAEEEDPVEIVDDLTGATEEEIESGIPEDVSSETAPEISEEETAEKAPEEADGGAEDDDLLARLKESLNSGGPDFPDDPLADLKEHENGGPQQQAGYEDFSFTELLRGVMGDKPENDPEETAAETPAGDAEVPAENAVPASPDELDFYDGEEHEDGEDFDPSSLIRRNRPGRDLDNK